ncbi:hypothetical protein [Streptomyces capparidis]
MTAFTVPVLSDQRHHTTALDVLRVLRPHSVLAVHSVTAISMAAGADLCRPLLVIDLGAHLTEVALLADGEVVTAVRGAARALRLASPGAGPHPAGRACRRPPFPRRGQR